jgi:hypothetical protein
MDSRKAWTGAIAALFLLALIWLLNTSEREDVTDWKELYRETFHTQAADMEAAQRKRRDQAN